MSSSIRLTIFSFLAFALSHNAAIAQGALTNGATHTGAIPVGGSNTWTIQATQNDSIVASIGEVLASGDPDPLFSPWIRLRDPNGADVDSSFGPTGGQIDARAPLTGLYTLLVTHSAPGGQVGTGNYTLTVAKTPGPYTITVGDEGGPITNGATHTGMMPIGDLDTWTIQATQNDSIVASIGEVLASGGPDPLFSPWIRLRGPNGADVDSSFGPTGGQIDARAPLTGLYTLLVTHSAPGGQVGTGNYTLTVAKTPGPYTITVGDEGGPIINGATHTGMMPIGDLDTWTIQATQNDSIVASIGEVLASGGSDPLFSPWIRLRGPNGADVDSSFGPTGGQIDARAPLTGLYTLLVTHSAPGGQVGTGNYTLTVAKTPGPYTITVGDEGGPITSGPNAGAIQIGDLDAWTVQAAANDRIAASILEALPGGGPDPLFSPWIRLRGPDGADVDSSFGPTGGQIDARVPLTGLYTLLVTHSAPGGQVGTGNYILTVTGPPPATITTHPQSQTIASGQLATLTVVATGSGLSYQWYVGPSGTTTNPIAGATSSSYTTPALISAVSYWVHVSNAFGSANSNTATITIGVGPAITTHPVSQAVTAGANATFTVAASGTLPVTYQWQLSTNAGGSFTDLQNSVPYSGSTTATLTVTGAAASLNAYRYRAIASNGAGSATSTSVMLTVYGAAGAVPATLQFGATKSGAALGVVTAAQTVSVTFSGAASGWTASADQTWVQLADAAGAADAQFTVSIVNPADAIAASTSLIATITVTASNASNSPLTIPVTLRVSQPGTTAAPIGSFDTPAPGNVEGSIAVTGWALDDIEVERVEIWRDLQTGETTTPFNAPGHPGHGKVFIATPLFVSGARPDVEAAYPTRPFAHRSGWGYLLLTWGLWNQGNGPFTLYAFAFDKDAYATTLGNKTINSTNNTATKPFGGIDVPAYGQTMTVSFWNFGWALSPKANTADPRTCTIVDGNVSVAIDSGPLTPVTYGGARGDIATAFPGFSNGSNGGGAYYIDVAPLANGPHSIGWYVVDNCGRAEGVGSRFFTVAKTSPVPESAASFQSGDLRPESDADSRRVDRVSVGRPGAPWIEVRPSAAGVHVVAVAQNGRIEVQLPHAAGESYAGAQIVAGESRALPLGSSLDEERGVFYWMPASGFLGAFDLEFSDVGRALTGPPTDDGPKRVRPIRLRVVVGPPIRMAVDTPATAAVVPQPFNLSGWALDLAATDEGSGIDAVHVWAYPAGGGDPIFVGVADLGGVRRDVSATYGPQFERSSYELVARGLAPGIYDLVVSAHRAATTSFDGVQVVRVSLR